jgi:hypothetical protein
MASRFVSPDVVRLPLTEGDWIDVKKRLNTGEQRRVFAKMARDMVPGEKVKLDPEQVGIAKVLEYLIGWSLTDGVKPVPLSAAAVGNLEVETFNEIREAIEAHEEKQDAIREQEKNEKAGGPASKPTSPSPVDAIGDMSGSPI